ncbi:hypothetical protein Zmor_001660 [Zophobas morio]|uniref:PHD-type domain-containing protein n=1 Tax=Zophobas morio TaxID=2755281 RepID=A0AA38J7V5_9CUCU|nr:hypothetical protein Zmor_001660 [Zophobas morio]
MSQCSKCRSNKKDGLVGCEGTCNKWFHYSCVNLTESDFKVLEKSKNLFFLCDGCKTSCEIVEKSHLGNLSTNIKSIDDKVGELNKTYEKQFSDMQAHFENFKSELTSSFQSQFNELKDSLAEKSIKNEETVTYASAVKQTTSIIFQPKDQSQSVATTKSEILRNVDPVKTGVSIRNTKTARNGSLIVRCDKNLDTEKIAKVAKDTLGEKYTIKQLPVINPRIRVVGITDKEITTDDLSDYIIHQNGYLFVGEPYCKVEKITPLRKDNKRFQATIEVNIATYNNIIKNGYLIVGYDDCIVYDAIDIKLFYQCCGYHHYYKQCSNKLPICPKCSGSHNVKECKCNQPNKAGA